MHIEVPPLRSRRSDIPELAEHFLRQYQLQRSGELTAFSDEALQALLLYDYPGNIRELEHLIQRAVLMTPGPLITLEHLPELSGGPVSKTSGLALQELLTLPMEEATRALERILITQALTRTVGNKAEAARLLGIHRQTLYIKLKELGLRQGE